MAAHCVPKGRCSVGMTAPHHNRLRHAAKNPPKDSMEFSLLVLRLHEQWQQALQTGSSFNGRETEPDASLLMWHAAPSRLTALYAPAGWLGASLKLPANARDIRWRLLASGAPAGAEPPMNTPKNIDVLFIVVLSPQQS